MFTAPLASAIGLREIRAALGLSCEGRSLRCPSCRCPIRRHVDSITGGWWLVCRRGCFRGSSLAFCERTAGVDLDGAAALLTARFPDAGAVVAQASRREKDARELSAAWAAAKNNRGGEAHAAAYAVYASHNLFDVGKTSCWDAGPGRLFGLLTTAEMTGLAKPRLAGGGWLFGARRKLEPGLGVHIAIPYEAGAGRIVGFDFIDKRELHRHVVAAEEEGGFAFRASLPVKEGGAALLVSDPLPALRFHLRRLTTSQELLPAVAFVWREKVRTWRWDSLGDVRRIFLRKSETDPIAIAAAVESDGWISETLAGDMDSAEPAGLFERAEAGAVPWRRWLSDRLAKWSATTKTMACRRLLDHGVPPDLLIGLCPSLAEVLGVASKVAELRKHRVLESGGVWLIEPKRNPGRGSRVLCESTFRVIEDRDGKPLLLAVESDGLRTVVEIADRDRLETEPVAVLAELGVEVRFHADEKFLMPLARAMSDISS